MTTSVTSPTTTTELREKRFLYHIPSMNTYHVFKAVSKQEAQHQFINSPAAPYYRQAVLLTPDD